jgi:cytochrome c biogenesis protein CcmG/thiol:disulfide interchange protein DsbE
MNLFRAATSSAPADGCGDVSRGPAAGKAAGGRRGQMAAAVLATAMAVGLAACSSHARPGAPAPGFALTSAAGRPVTLRGFRGKVLVLNFWATWCPPCVEETPSLNALAAALKGRPIAILAVSIDTNAQRYRQFLQQYHVQYLTARDPSAALPHRYGTVKYPETYIVNSRGEVVRKIVGAINWDSPQMVRYLKDLAAGRVPGSPAAG